MNLLPIEIDTWAIYAVCDSKGNCDILNFLGTLDTKYTKLANKLLALLRRISRQTCGPNDLQESLSHAVDQKEKIYEFVTGDLRLLWFYSHHDRRVVICSNAFLKKTQKTPAALKNQAIAAKKQYEKAVKEGTLIVQEA